MPDCTICCNPAILEVQLSCDHVACYLCIKKIINEGSNRCNVCNKKFKKNILDQEIDPDDNPQNVAWYYKSVKNDTWWLFDPVSNDTLESMYDKFINEPNYDMKNHHLNISGIKYFYDFTNMLQISEFDKKRKIKREINSKTSEALGIAGAKYTTTITID